MHTEEENSKQEEVTVEDPVAVEEHTATVQDAGTVLATSYDPVYQGQAGSTSNSQTLRPAAVLSLDDDQEVTKTTESTVDALPMSSYVPCLAYS